MEIAHYYETRYVQETSCLTESINVTSLTLIHGYERRTLKLWTLRSLRGKPVFLLIYFFILALSEYGAGPYLSKLAI